LFMCTSCTENVRYYTSNLMTCNTAVFGNNVALSYLFYSRRD